MGVIGDGSSGTPPIGSGSGEAWPGMRSTKEKSRWSHRKGSLVSSLPGNGVVRGKCNWSRERMNSFTCQHINGKYINYCSFYQLLLQICKSLSKRTMDVRYGKEGVYYNKRKSLSGKNKQEIASTKQNRKLMTRQDGHHRGNP